MRPNGLRMIGILGFRSVIAIWILLCAIPNSSLAQSCETVDSIPADHKKLGSGSATVHYSGVTKVKGGQVVYVKIKNENVLGVSYVLTIEEDVQPAATICTYKALLPPGATAVLRGGLFGDPPIPWKITVEVGDESDAGVLTYEVYSLPPPQRKNSQVSWPEKSMPSIQSTSLERVQLPFLISVRQILSWAACIPDRRDQC